MDFKGIIYISLILSIFYPYTVSLAKDFFVQDNTLAIQSELRYKTCKYCHSNHGAENNTALLNKYKFRYSRFQNFSESSLGPGSVFTQRRNERVCPRSRKYKSKF